MYWLDTVIVGVLAFGALFGSFAGFLWQLSRIISVAAAAYGTIVLNDPATLLVQKYLMSEAPPLIPRVTAYVLVFLLICLALFALTVALHRIVLRLKLQWLNRVLGGLFGAGKAALILGVIFLGLSGYAGPQAAIEKSRLAQGLVDVARWAADQLPEEYREQIDRQLNTADPLSPSILPQGKKTPVPRPGL